MYIIPTLRNVCLFKHYDVTLWTYLHTYTAQYISTLLAPTHVTRAAAVATARRCRRHTSLVDHFMYRRRRRRRHHRRRHRCRP